MHCDCKTFDGFDGKVELLIFSGVLTDAQTAEFAAKLNHSAANRSNLVIDLRKIKPPCAKLIIQVMGVSNRAKDRGGDCYVVPPGWIPVLRRTVLTKHGITLVNSVEVGLKRFGVTNGTAIEAEPQPPEDSEPEVPPEGQIERDQPGRTESLVSELASALEYYLRGENIEGEIDDDDEFDNVIGGHGGLLSELKSGISYWANRFMGGK